MRSALIGPALVAALAVFVPASSAQVSRAPAAIQEPPVALRLYLVDIDDGSLTALESGVIGNEKWNLRRYSYLEGPHSSFAIPRGVPLVFAYRREMREKDFEGYARTGEGVAGLFKIEVLAINTKGKGGGTITEETGRRYATGQYAPVHEEPYGPRKTGIDPRKPNLSSQTYVFWPTLFLEPAEYGLSPFGLIAEDHIWGAHAFRVAAAGPPARPAPPAPPPASPVSVAPPASSAEAAAGTARVTIESSPSDAEVTVDGEFIGTTPLAGYALGAGRRRIIVTKKGYAPWVRDLRVTPGVDTRLAAELERSGGGD